MKNGKAANEEIEYQARGKLIAAKRCGKDWLVLVEHVEEFIVSEYCDGALLWVSGRYFDKLSEAAAEFEQR